ncbi:MAG TPA: hypothetical protein VER04_23505 [Polyangiaceae bacterium]|nr:hypothetical protein [Polyangiaceae bacterium]
MEVGGHFGGELHVLPPARFSVTCGVDLLENREAALRDALCTDPKVQMKRLALLDVDPSLFAELWG